MAGNDFHLYIHLGEAGEGSAMAGGAKNKSDSASSGSDSTAIGIKSAVKKIVSYATIKATADQVISGNLSMVELNTGSAEYEQRLQAGYNLGKQIWNAGEIFVLGGLAGGLPGAIAGLFISGVHMAISYSFRAATLAKEENLENVSIGLMNVRAGTAGRRSRDQ